MDMKQNENPQKNPNKRVTKVIGKKGKKRNQPPELVPGMVNEWKPESKVNAVRKKANGDLSSKPETNTVFRSKHSN